MKTDILDFPDNLILQLERDRRSYKCFTTDKRDYFKVINGLYEKDSVIDTSFVSKRDLKQLMVDSVINGYTLKLNLIFKEGFHGVVNELAAERRLRIAEQELLTKNEVAAEILSDSEDENVKVTYEEEIPEKYF
jgi:hypothetical protein